MSFVLAIDQGTTSSRAIVFRSDISIAATAQQEFPQHFPASGWVEHEPEDIWTSTVTVCREALEKAGLTAKDIAAIGITNQRETTVVWDRATGRAVHRAIVWQDRRTADICARLKTEGHEPAISAKTGRPSVGSASSRRKSVVLREIEISSRPSASAMSGWASGAYFS